jgi:hypothetical protein
MMLRSNPLLDRYSSGSQPENDFVIRVALPPDLPGSQLSHVSDSSGASAKPENPALPASLYNRAIHV